MSVYWIIYITGFFVFFVASIILISKFTDFDSDLVIVISLLFALMWFALIPSSIIIVILYPVYKFILKIISKIRK